MNINHPTEEQVRSRAYQIYLERRGQSGHQIDDWVQAEYELLQLPVRKLAELEPPMRKKGSTISLVSLVQAAVFVGVKVLPHLKR